MFSGVFSRKLKLLLFIALALFLTVGAYSVITFAAAASELGFHYRTGGEVEWSDAGDFANDEGLNVLISESSSVVVSALIILIVSWLPQNYLYRTVGNVVSSLGKRIASGMFIRYIIMTVIIFNIYKSVSTPPRKNSSPKSAVSA